MRPISCIFLLLFALVPAMFSAGVPGAAELTEEEMRDFLLTAEVVRAIQTGKGTTSPYRFTLRKGEREHDASFQPVDEATPFKRFDDGKTEMNFRDSWKYNIAAYELARLLGLGDMMPVTVERRWKRKTGSLSWWLPVVMDEEKRRRDRIPPPDPADWNRRMFKMAVFSEWVYDTDRNLGNILYSKDWHVWMIDFSRAFRLYTTLRTPANLVRCERRLLERLRELRRADVEARAGRWLTRLEIDGLMARRDRIVEHFDRLVLEKGERAVLYTHP